MNKNFIFRDHCPVCGQPAAAVLISKDYQDPELCQTIVSRFYGAIAAEDLAETRYEVAYCLACEFLYQTYIPTSAFSERMYSYAEARREISYTKKQNRNINFFMRAALDAQKIPLFFKKNLNDIKVLEFGVGWGDWARMVTAFGMRCVGTEIAPHLIAHCRKMGLEIRQDVAEFGDETFDFIRVDNVLEHLNNPLSYVESFASRLAPGGILQLIVPNCLQTVSDVQNAASLLKNIYPLEHINGFTHKTLVTLGHRCGLRIASPNFIAKVLLRSLPKNFHFLHEIAVNYYRQLRSTHLLFIKE